MNEQRKALGFLESPSKLETDWEEMLNRLHFLIKTTNNPRVFYEILLSVEKQKHRGSFCQTISNAFCFQNADKMPQYFTLLYYIVNKSHGFVVISQKISNFANVFKNIDRFIENETKCYIASALPRQTRHHIGSD